MLKTEPLVFQNMTGFGDGGGVGACKRGGSMMEWGVDADLNSTHWLAQQEEEV